MMLTRQAASTVSAAARSRAVLTRSASSIALKYAHAAYGASLAQSPQTLTKVAGELSTISTTIKNTPDLAAFVTNPTISAKDRATGLQGLFAAAEGTGAKRTPLSDITKNLLIVMSENGRLAEAGGVIETFQELVSKYKGELEVVVTSAAPLQRDIMTRLENSLKASQTAQKAKSVKVTNKVRFCQVSHFALCAHADVCTVSVRSIRVFWEVLLSTLGIRPLT
jgi:F-type H+-transporting ATPase subunit O